MKVKIVTPSGIIVDGIRRDAGAVVEMPTKRAAQMAELGKVEYAEAQIEIVPAVPIKDAGEVLPAGEPVFIETQRAVRLCLHGKATPVVPL